jgi:hypothetical protein
MEASWIYLIELVNNKIHHLLQSKSHVDRTSIFQKTTSTYQLKMKTSRSTYGEIVKKAGAFPFTLRTLEDQTKARMGVKECVQHGLLKEFDVT